MSQHNSASSNLRDVREDRAVEQSVNDAYRKWARADEAWEAVTWALARDPYSAGPAITESGNVRVFVFEGARSFHMPTVRVVYLIEPHAVTIKSAFFEESIHMYAGRA